MEGNAGGHLLLPLDRFVNNPTYESTGGGNLLDLSIPIFSPEEVKLMSQIGQGCFGKVFKGTTTYFHLLFLDNNLVEIVANWVNCCAGEINGGELVAIKVVKKEYSDEVIKEVS